MASHIIQQRCHVDPSVQHPRPRGPVAALQDQRHDQYHLRALRGVHHEEDIAFLDSDFCVPYRIPGVSTLRLVAESRSTLMMSSWLMASCITMASLVSRISSSMPLHGQTVLYGVALETLGHETVLSAGRLRMCIYMQAHLAHWATLPNRRPDCWLFIK